MKAEPRAVVDTNVIISAALVRDGPPGRVVRHLLAHGRLVFSEATFAELEQRLWRPKFDRYVSPDQRRLLLHDLAASAQWVTTPDAGTRSSRDRDDDKFVHAALAARADLLISGDGDLLMLGEPGGIPVMTPAAALAWLLGEQP
ncbi:MAG: putative toxin-antitoxin system toxin component, PIN family [Burkholderiaceae bacterium]|jgi:putative PIN family toxin of toxin-antitoxin system|nr:putative toxin-antitoxin system toxin component, PIN family [Burkholderiaceae bacterium]MCU0939289.1 putative toxin-antitoxin system toxin component, PIN family [Burkholderiaceae bacterium]